MDTNQETGQDKVGEALKAQRFHMLEDIAKELKGNIVFPTYFDADLHLRKALQDPDLPTARLASIVSLEPLIATKLMKLANSVLYNPQCILVHSLPAAITRIGFNQVRATSLAIAMDQMLRCKEMAVFGDLTRALWIHSLKSAAAAHVLASNYTRINPDEALLAGLVHDLGAFYMIYRAAQYPELRSRRTRSNISSSSGTKASASPCSTRSAYRKTSSKRRLTTTSHNPSRRPCAH